MNSMDKEVEREDGGGIGRQAKFGLALIALLVIVFVVVLIMKIRGPEARTLASDATSNADDATSTRTKQSVTGGLWEKPKRGPATLEQPRIVSPKSNMPSQSASRRSHSWLLASDQDDPASNAAGTATTSAVALMPSPSGEAKQLTGATDPPARIPPATSDPWAAQTAATSQTEPSKRPPDPFHRDSGRRDNASTTSNYYPSNGGYGASGSPYTPYSSSNSSSSGYASAE
ncbi:MAG: hypothetical protein JW888_05305, partial [Pirellulales bacterium]|nr:hypothetical protein [Pirellulales bacterium]